MRILVTGSSGHLGEALIRTLRKANREVIGIDLLPSPFTDRVGSIADPAFVKEVMRNVDAVLHTATLHKPHIGSHSLYHFIETNVIGTLHLLEEAVQNQIRSFVYTSTTSTFGDALTPATNQPAAWITENVRPVPKNIYGVSKTSAEDLCQLFYRNQGLPCVILKTSRFFPEADDQDWMRLAYADANAKANEMLYRRADIQDVVSAHLLAMQKAESLGFSRYIISATTPFRETDLTELNTDAPAVVGRLYPSYAEIYQRLGWKMFPVIDRVYVNTRARTDLGWSPTYDFGYILEKLNAGENPKSELAIQVGSKGYHAGKL